MAFPALEIPTPWAPLSVIVTAIQEPIVLASWFGGHQENRIAGVDYSEVRWGEHVPYVSNAVDAWIDGELDAITAIPVSEAGGPFQQQVKAAMRTIPGGRVFTYAELAEAAGRPQAVRAVGTACARNHAAPFAPCHRVVASNGGLGGYGYGVPLKISLLEHEGVTNYR